MAKAIVDGFQDRIFHHLEIDLDQDMVTQALIAMDHGQEMNGMWPERFHNSEFEFPERLNGRVWKVKLCIHRIDIASLIKEKTEVSPSFTLWSTEFSPGSQTLHSTASM